MIGEMQLTQTGLTGRTDDTAWALRLYKNALAWGKARRLFGRLAGRGGELRSLDAVEVGGGRDEGLRAVPIDQIVGSEGRDGDFDARFAPLQEHSRDRWLSVALARRRGLSLPPVSLIRAEGGYYVRDGHHRISVARALGEEFIEAEVVSWG